MADRAIARAVPIDPVVVIDALPKSRGCLDFPVKLLHKQLTTDPFRVGGPEGAGVIEMVQEAPP
jgi:hypothetical protein